MTRSTENGIGETVRARAGALEVPPMFFWFRFHKLNCQFQLELSSGVCLVTKVIVRVFMISFMEVFFLRWKVRMMQKLKQHAWIVL